MLRLIISLFSATTTCCVFNQLIITPIFRALRTIISALIYYHLIMSSTSWQQMLAAEPNAKQTVYTTTTGTAWRITAEEDAVKETNYLDISQTLKRLVRVSFKRYENSSTAYICFKVFKRENQKDCYIRQSMTSITANELLLMREKSSSIDAVLDDLFAVSHLEKRRKLDDNGENAA